jgi:nucleotide-binding universal stress UspA family protein
MGGAMEGKDMQKKVLVPLDSSKLAECAISHVKDLAKYGIVGEVTLLNVVPQAYVPLEEGYKANVNLLAARDESLAASKRYLAALEARLSADGMKIKTDSVEAINVAGTIAEYAEKNGMDMIVMATHGYTGLKKIFLGSVASGVVQQSNVAVYLIRPDACRV